jgi:hypothetical protein
LFSFFFVMVESWVGGNRVVAPVNCSRTGQFAMT